MKSYYVIYRSTDAGKKLYMTAHRRSSEAFSGFDVVTDPEPRKALMFGSEKNANDRAKDLSSELETYRVEPYKSTAKVGDMLPDDSQEKKADLAEKS